MKSLLIWAGMVVLVIVGTTAAVCMELQAGTLWSKALKTGISAFTALVLAVTAGMVYKYAKETQNLRKLTRQSTEFSALIQVHQELGSRPTYRLRRLLYTEFDKRLRTAVEECWPRKYVDDKGEIKIDAVLEKMPANPAELRRFINKLAAQKCQPDKAEKSVTCLDVVERTLLPFDSIAVPFCEGIESAARAAVSYRPILERTAKHIMPFVAIQMKLRGAPDYKLHYLCLLYALCISLPKKLKSRVNDALQNKEFVVSLKEVKEMRARQCKRHHECKQS